MTRNINARMSRSICARGFVEMWQPRGRWPAITMFARRGTTRLTNFGAPDWRALMQRHPVVLCGCAARDIFRGGANGRWFVQYDLSASARGVFFAQRLFSVWYLPRAENGRHIRRGHYAHPTRTHRFPPHTTPGGPLSSLRCRRRPANENFPPSTISIYHASWPPAENSAGTHCGIPPRPHSTHQFPSRRIWHTGFLGSCPRPGATQPFTLSGVFNGRLLPRAEIGWRAHRGRCLCATHTLQFPPPCTPHASLPPRRGWSSRERHFFHINRHQILPRRHQRRKI